MGQFGGSACLPIPHEAPVSRELFPGGPGFQGSKEGQGGCSHSAQSLVGHWGGWRGSERGKESQPGGGEYPSGCPRPPGRSTPRPEGLAPSRIPSGVRKALS